MRVAWLFGVLLVAWPVVADAVESKCDTRAASRHAESDASDAVVSFWASTRSILRKCERALSVDANPVVLKKIGTAYLAKTFSVKANRQDLAEVLDSDLGGLTDREIRLCIDSYLSALNYSTSPDAKKQEITSDDDGGNCCQCDAGPICCGTDICYCTCEGEGGICVPACESSCFPGDATVVTEDGSAKFMNQLRVGDRVLVRYDDGSTGLDDIYLFTHKEQDAVRVFVELTTESGHRLLATAGHFIPISDTVDGCDWSRARMVSLDQVSTGDLVWVADGEGSRCSLVLHKAQRHGRGVFNPLTLSGIIVVNGVVASSHSDWILDGIVSASWQHTIYQFMFAPVRLFYQIVGAGWVEKMAEEWKVVDTLRTGISAGHRLHTAGSSCGVA